MWLHYQKNTKRDELRASVSPNKMRYIVVALQYNESVYFFSFKQTNKLALRFNRFIMQNGIITYVDRNDIFQQLFSGYTPHTLVVYIFIILYVYDACAPPPHIIYLIFHT